MFASSGVRIGVSAACAHRALMAASFGSKLRHHQTVNDCLSTITVGVSHKSTPSPASRPRTWRCTSNSRTRKPSPHKKSARLMGQGDIPSLRYSLVAVS